MRLARCIAGVVVFSGLVVGIVRSQAPAAPPKIRAAASPVAASPCRAGKARSTPARRRQDKR